MNSTMDANQTCELLLSLIKNPNLNYFLEETAFSVTIKMKQAGTCISCEVTKDY